MQTRVPYDSSYTALIGVAVYVFAYYEWAIVYLIQQFESGFVARYSRGAPMMSGGLYQKLEAILANGSTVYSAVQKQELQACNDEFRHLIDKRNALIHAHPITDQDGSQILSYQTRSDRALPDMKWPTEKVEAAIREFDAAACKANELLHRLLK